MRALEYENTLIQMLKYKDYEGYEKLLKVMYTEDRIMMYEIHCDLKRNSPKELADKLERIYKSVIQG